MGLMRGTVLVWASGRCEGGQDAVSGQRLRVAWSHQHHGSTSKEEHRKRQDTLKLQTSLFLVLVFRTIKMMLLVNGKQTYKNFIIRNGVCPKTLPVKRHSVCGSTSVHCINLAREKAIVNTSQAS